MSGGGRSEDRKIIPVSAGRRRDIRRRDHLGMLANETYDLVRQPRRHAESPREVPPQLAEDVLGSHDLVALQADFEQGLAQAARAECRQEDVRVEDEPHDTDLKTSSSVSRPWASANGSAFSRKERKRSTAI